MSKIKSSRAFASEKIQRFGGLGQSLLATDGRAMDMENFRIDSDGTLRKRTGYRSVRQFPHTVRAYWEGSIAQKNYLFAVSQSDIYQLDPLIGSSRIIGHLKSSYGRVDFVHFEDTLLIPDSDGLLAFNVATNSFSAITPYVPLYGRNWDPVNGGSINEPLNLLTNHIRVYYTNTTSQTTFRLPFYTKAIDSLRVNGRAVTNYSFTSGSNTLTIPADSTGYTVEMGIEIMIDLDSSGILTAQKAAVYNGRHHSTLCLYDSDLAYRIYTSSFVSANSMAAARAHYPSCQPVYFKDRNVLLAGDKSFPVTTICPYGTHMLAYSGKCTWDISCPEDDGDATSISLLLPTIGCTAPESAIVCNSHPVFANQDGIFMLDIPKSDTEKPKVTRISDAISNQYGLGLASNCIARDDRIHHELWIRDPQASDSRVLVYNYQIGEWYAFSNMNATHFIDLPDFQGFTSANLLVLLDNDVYTDDYEPITAFYQSGYFDFSHPEEKKRALRLTLCKTTPDCQAFLDVETEHASRTFEIPSNDVGKPDVLDTRALMGRFRFLRFRILVTGLRDYRIFSLSFHANL